MQTIEIQYRPIAIIPWERTFTAKHPDNWNDITEKQLIAIVSGAKNRISVNLFLHIMTDIPLRIIKKMGNFQIYQLNELLNFITVSQSHNTFILKKITVSGCNYFAPLPKLKKMSFGQFIFADTHFGNWQDKQEPGEAAMFLASLYLAENRKFSEDITEQNAKVFNKVSAETLEAVAVNYLLIKEWLANTYPLVFQGAEPEQENRKPRPEKSRDPMAWVKIFESLVGDDLINQDRWADMPIHNVLRYMNRKIKENMKRK